MERRLFLKSIFGALAASMAMPVSGLAAIVGRRVLVQASPIAGFQYYRGEALFDQMREGLPLQLVREAENRHDRNAVAVYFQGEKLGFVPRAENYAISNMMDRGEHLSARIVKLSKQRNPWKRVQFEVAVDG